MIKKIIASYFIDIRVCEIIHTVHTVYIYVCINNDAITFISKIFVWFNRLRINIKINLLLNNIRVFQWWSLIYKLFSSLCFIS